MSPVGSSALQGATFGFLFALISGVAGGCSDKTATTDDTDSGSDSGVDSGADSAEDTSGGGDDTDEGGASLTGKVVWADGTVASSGVQARMCLLVCRAISTGSDGSFTFDGSDAGTYALEIVALGQQDDYGTPQVPITLGEGEVRTLQGSIVLPAFAAKTALSTATEFTGDGLVIEADPAGLTAGFNSPSTSPYVAAVSVLPDGSLPVDGVSGTVVAMWHLGLFDATLSPAWAYHVTDTLGLSEGTVLHAYVSSYDERTWMSAGTATVGADAITSDTGSGIPELTTLILVSE